MKKLLMKRFLKIVLLALLAVAAFCCGANIPDIRSYSGYYSEMQELRERLNRAYDAVGNLLASCVLDGSVSDSSFANVNGLGIEYYAKCGDVVITNTGVTDYSVYRSFPAACGADCKSFVIPDGEYSKPEYANAEQKRSFGGVTYGIELNNEFICDKAEFNGVAIPRLMGMDYSVYVKLTDDEYELFEDEVSYRENVYKAAKEAVMVSLLIGLAAFVALLFLAEKKRLKLDRLYGELRLLGAALAAFVSCQLVYEFSWASDIAELAGLFAALGALAVTAVGMSFARDYKTGNLREGFFVLQNCRKIRAFVFAEGAKRFGGGRVIGAFVGFCALFFIAGLMPLPLFLVMAAVLTLGGAGFVMKRISGMAQLYDGIERMADGDFSTPIDGCPEGVTGHMQERLNSINEGTRLAIEREIKAERMKSELITNVSHDLKTPLTSIISYADLLCKQDLQPEAANDYAQIIYKKAQSLKKLTSDLFDISKAESGSETAELEELDLCQLLRQSMGELNTELEASGLDFRLSLPEDEIRISGDGKKLSRVLENLITNCIKYSMPNSRVYIRAYSEDGCGVAELKNISAEPMDFDADEITERFVRGDLSRSTEGSGLGLAIAKSYTELCGGALKISTDGDLFKVKLSLRCC